MKLDFSEIEDWGQFEDLMVAYLRKLQEDPLNKILSSKVDPSGKGPDGGRDIIVIFLLTDGISTYERKWVVQCKFYNQAVSASHLNSINIPSLIHSQKANGYLLVCRKDVTASCTQLFENLRKNCNFTYQYDIWKGTDFLDRLYNTPSLHQQFFPKYHIELRKLTTKPKKVSTAQKKNKKMKSPKKIKRNYLKK